jgi:hypothetical protein
MIANLSPSTIPLTRLRHFIQERQNEQLFESVLRRHFDPAPAEAMLKHRVPQNRWRNGQIAGANFHTDLFHALRSKVSLSDAPAHLRPALQVLRRYHFAPLIKGDGEEVTCESPECGLRGRLDLVGYAGAARAVIEVKTIHQIPHDYPHVEHAIQASASFLLAWGHRPHSEKHFCRILYVESSSPHRAFLMRVSMANRFADVATDLAQSLLNRRN